MTLGVASGPRFPRGARTRRLAIVGCALLVAAAVAALLRGGEDPGLERPPGLGDFWAGHASLVLDRKWTSTALGATGGSGAYSGAHVEVVDGTWYLFNRRTTDTPCPGRGPGAKQTGTEVRPSRDRGATWSEPVAILRATPGTAWSCVASDGDAAYDPERRIWRYLFQCEGASPGWHGCYAERRGASPLGAFTAPEPDPNPVIAPGALWSRICDDPGDECARAPDARPVVDEGTFNVFDFDGSSWLVGFHGHDGNRAYRGVARTSTFRRDGWQVDGEGGTPTDAVVGPADAASWRESWQAAGPVGAGAGSVLPENGWQYLLVEVPDTSLACTAGQSWNLGLLRAARADSTTWEQLPAGNPVVYSSRAAEAGGQVAGCNVEYPGLFRDDRTGTTYLSHGRVSTDPGYDALYVYRLAWNRSLLRNGDFWRADADGWQALAGTPAQLRAEREPNQSPDGTPYLMLSCGTPTCDGGASVHQDAAVDPARHDGTLAFGGSFRADTGTGRLDLAVHQLDAGGEQIATESVPVRLAERYVRARGTFELAPATRRLRYEIYPRTPGAVRADNLYLIPQDGCPGPDYPRC